MCRFVSLLLIILATPGLLLAQEVIRTSRYELDRMDIKSSVGVDVLRGKYGIPASFSIISPSLGDDILLAVYRTDYMKASGAVIHPESYPDVFKNDAVELYMLFSKEPVIIGGHAYMFDADGAAYRIYYIKDGFVATVMISANEAFLSQDGYLLKAWRLRKHE